MVHAGNAIPAGLSRRMVLAGSAVLLARPVSAAETRDAVLYKDPACGCCTGHARHLEENGFRVTVKPAPDLDAIRAAHGVPQELAGCHTILIGEFVVEGHVPASVIDRLLHERPEGILGLAIPGMPGGVPGMPGDRTEPLPVFAFDAAGKYSVFASI
jgi:hypothetical protein